ncbi:hypothetical protein ACKKBG_A17815 [Auxenochlorella protothecoides x Auxenochlorella symbiontica]|uniref:von Hippel-Lindau disease tumour suppressor beta domain-containing protein n=2 Tax=Auxenochlorella protothecoides TaxID=3075 RepID=A0A087SF58_AUXPR|nr:hypothetical protein F751_3080 [Auxenochlorella protothecoides]KFM24362.1 hypothetical protein F751_3080 [Auxenochlorella protothecoides]
MARSKDCKTACRHRFNNDTDGPVKFLWIDYDGQEHAYATVFPGQSHIQDTYTSHPWRARVADTGAEIGEYVGPGATLTVLPGARLRVEPGLQPRRPPDMHVAPWGWYRQRGRCARGHPIYAFDCVPDAAVRLAAFTMDCMTAHLPAPAVSRMHGWGAFLAIIGRGQVTTDIPQYAQYRGQDSGNGGGRVETATRGLGGGTSNPVSSVGEENLTMEDDVHYGCESILIHEWAHAVMDLGYAEQPLQAEIVECWKAAEKRGTYVKGSYIISNPGEYWAEASQAWFEATMRDDVTSGLKTRDAVKRADPWLASLLTRVYGDGPWRYWHTCPRPFTGDEARWQAGRALGGRTVPPVAPYQAVGGAELGWPAQAGPPQPTGPTPRPDQRRRRRRSASKWVEEVTETLAGMLKKL